MERCDEISEIIGKYLKPILSFTLKRTKTVQEAEDLAQEIVIKVYKALKNMDNIHSLDGYIWRIAHNTVANYYRSKSRSYIGVNLNETIKLNTDSVEEAYIKHEEISKLTDKIAYLSKLQRQIIILYYYEGKKQEEISQLLNIPKGTVKWHLFESKKELKKGMEKMDNRVLELKFNPIKFSHMSVNGSIGREGGTSNFFKSVLSQNIVYSIYDEGRTINEIADLLSVSPVYIESEVEYLEEYSFISKLSGNKYISNILIDEVTEEGFYLLDKMYRDASKLIVKEIYNKLMESNLLDSENIYYPDKDKNFTMWSIIPYIIAQSRSGEEDKIKFEDVATIRKDGGCYIASASIDKAYLENTKALEDRDGFIGPMWNEYNNHILWQINSKWCTRNVNIDLYEEIAQSEISLLDRYINEDNLSSEEFSYLAEKGYIKGNIGQDELNIIWIKNSVVRDELLAIGSKVKIIYQDELKKIKSDYIRAVLKDTPKHLRKVREFELQDIFSCNGVFLLYSLMELLDLGGLYEVEDEYKKKVLQTLLITNSCKE